MDSVFFLDVEARALFFQSIAQATGCTYICLWSYVPLISSHLFCIDGWCNVDSHQPSSSSGSLAQRLFIAYRKTLHAMDNSFVPGFVFKKGIPYLELNDLDLLQRASDASQHQFYQAARIKSAAFLSCRSGEIEIGTSTSIPVNLIMEINNWFQQYQFKNPIPPPRDQDWLSSSSSSLKSLSVGSPDNSSLFFSMPSSTRYTPEFLKETQLQVQAITPTSSTFLPQQAYSNLSIQYLNPESDNAEMTKAMLAVISSSPCSSSSSYNQPHQTRTEDSHVNQKPGAFKEYHPSLAPNLQPKVNPGKQNMLKRSIAMMRNIDISWREELAQGAAPSNSQLHHKISERKRREKLNESFDELRSLLPAGSKKDKASVLSNTVDYLSNLKTEVLELKQKNQELEARTSHLTEASVGSSNEKIEIDITQVSNPTQEEQVIDLRATVRGDCDMIDLIINILQFLKLLNGATLLSINADTKLQPTPINRVTLSLKIQGGEIDKQAFEEAVKRIVGDVVK